jgi:hypothetical protein
MELLGKAFFDPSKRICYMDALIAKNREELLNYWDSLGATRSDVEPRAFTTFYPFKNGMRKFGELVFNWNDCEVPIVVHECVHAAEYYAYWVRRGEELKKLKGAAKKQCNEELLPTLVENLVSQVWIALQVNKNSQV